MPISIDAHAEKREGIAGSNPASNSEGGRSSGMGALKRACRCNFNGVWDFRCDRILWKSTVEPEPDLEDEESEVPYPKTRTRVGQFLANIKMRYRKGSYSSCTSSELSNHDHAPPSPLER